MYASALTKCSYSSAFSLSSWEIYLAVFSFSLVRVKASLSDCTFFSSSFYFCFYNDDI